MHTEMEMRKIVLAAIDNCEPCELRDRIRGELRRSGDKNSHHRRARVAHLKLIAPWAEKNLVASLDDTVPFAGTAAWWAFCADHPKVREGVRPLGTRTFYAELERCGYTLDRRGATVVIPGVELSR